MVSSRSVLYSIGKNDELRTPPYGVKPIIKYIPKDAVVWCPFDKPDSEYVRQIKENGNKVVNSHIELGQNFYTYEPEEHWDILVSNPPFTNKRRIFERALSFNKPFALLMSNTWLNDSAPIHLFYQKQLQLLMLDKRIYFIKPDGSVHNRPTFSCSYFCYNLLPSDLICEILER